MYQGLVIDNDQPIHIYNIMKFEEHLSEMKLTSLSLNEVLSAKLRINDFSLFIINTDDITTRHIDICRRIRLLSKAPIVIISQKFNYHMMKEAAYCQVNDVISGTNTTEDSIIESLQTIISNFVKSTYKHKIEAFSLRKNESECVIEQIKSLVQSDLDKQLTLKQISKQLHFNYAYLGQKFKHKLNISFNEYLLQQRMEKAKQLLSHTDLKIYEVANQVGYTEIDWFYKKFKEYTGVSANEYRKKTDFSYAN